MTQSTHKLDVELTLYYPSGNWHDFFVEGIPCTWVWGESTREQAEFDAVRAWVASGAAGTTVGHLIHSIVSSKAT
jgi:hypothetical protein